jgi:hypothetical protein
MRKKKIDPVKVEAELVKGKRIVRAEKKKLKRIGDNLKRANKKRAIESMEAGTDAVKKLRDTAEELEDKGR